ncbi:MAG: TonB-dependent receptor [Vicinamibacterales bacterium]
MGYDRPLGAARLGTIASFTRTTHDNFRGFLTDVSAGPDNAVAFRQQIDTTDLYADVHVALPERRQTRVVVGADWLHGMGDSKGAVVAFTAPLTGGSGAVVGKPSDLSIGSEDRREFLGLYALTEWRPAPRVTLSAGLRANLTAEEREEGGEQGDDAGDEGRDRQTHTRLSGSIGALVSLWESGPDHVRAFANYRDTFKPAVFDFGLGEAEEGGLLEPETSRSAEGGVKARMIDGRLDVEASAFRMDFRNLVTATVVNGLPALLNAGETRFQGIEVAADAHLPAHLTARASYGFHDGRFVDFAQAFDGVVTQLGGRRFEMSARHLVSAGAYRSPDHGVLASAVVRYTGDRYMDKRNRALAPGFATIDVGAGYRFDRYELRVDGRNLGDARDVVAESEVGDAQYYRMTARDIRLSLGVRF